MDKPLFSIVIPTKNRPHVLRESLDSWLAQTLKNFEIIIVDNSTDGAQTSNVVSSYNDPRIKYVRTGGLSMPDNWDTALRQGSGKYVYITGDKCIMCPDTLEKVARGIDCTGLDVLAFRDIMIPKNKWNRPNSWNVIETAPIIRDIVNGRSCYPSLPGYSFRGYVLFLSRTYLEALLEKYGRIAIPVSPDFTIGFFAVLNCEKIAYCSESFFLRWNETANSNGWSSFYGGDLMKEFLNELGKDEQYILEHVPVKVLCVANTVFNDKIRVCKLCGIEHHMGKPELIAYWKEVHAELCMIEAKFHISRTDDFRKCYDFAESNNLIMHPEIIRHLEEHSLMRQSTLPPPIPFFKRAERKLRKWIKPKWRKLIGKNN